ncbi:MAG: ferrichrome ABC transporter permease, partial [Verrucomicrobiota bacterium]
MPAFSLAIFWGALLLFLVQPLIAKYILPWFGGSPAVWTTCMLFFQLLLLGGYAYAHFSTTRLRTRTQVIVHLSLL